MQGYLLAISTWFLLANCQTPKNDFFSSTVLAPRLIKSHDQLVNVIRLYAEAANNAAIVFNRYLFGADASYISQPWDNYGDPLRTYHLVKRTSTDINELVDVIRNLRALDPLLEIENLRRTGEIPNDNDFYGVAQALVRLQKVYRLNPLDMAAGKIRDDLKLSVKLTASDCLYLGKVAEQQSPSNSPNVIWDTSMWFSAGLALISDDPMEQHIKNDLQLNLDRIHKQITDQMLSENTGTAVSQNLLNYSLPWNEVLVNYQRLCRGEKLRPAFLDVDCLCHLRVGPHPYMKLRPFKIEVLSTDPYLVFIHELVGEKEMAILKKEAVPLMERSSHLGANADNEKSDLRVSVTSWIDDFRVPTLNQRIEIITGLGARHFNWEAEQYQVLNYGVGGHYTPHYDYFSNLSQDEFYIKSGDRIATLMMYLSDVEAGGATAFPYMGLTLYPRKGSAAFWWNLRSDCNGDPMTTHGACPVLYGTKWVSNKWFRVHPQMFKASCGEHEYETMRQF